MFFSIPDSFVSVCFRHNKILLSKSRRAVLQQWQHLLETPISVYKLLLSLRINSYISIVLIIFILVFITIYAIFRALYNYDIDFFLITLIEEKSLFCRIYGAGIAIFGFFVSIDFLYWVFLLYV